VPYEHRVAARVEDRLVSFPVNRTTFEQFFNRSFADEAELKNFIGTIVEDIPEPRNAAEFLATRIGREMTDLFFRPYTLKMWSLDLEDLDSSVVRRIPIRMDRDDRYFPNDKFQILPRHGYTRIFENILDHDGIRVDLNITFTKSMERDYDAVFLSSPIDDYFDCRFGELPYRSIRFHHMASRVDEVPVATINYTDASPFTRDYKENRLERYYPVKDASGHFKARYEQYAELAKTRPRTRFIGRCGTYTYLDMHQVINQSLISANQVLPPGLRHKQPGREATTMGPGD
jgi:UDP-galactopyranose mutase